MYKTRDSPKRKYSFKVVSYASWEELQPLIENTHHYVAMFHDKDDVDPHWHILCTFLQNKSYESVRRYVISEQNTLVQEMTDVNGDFEYLWHGNAPDKYQYDPASLVTDDLGYWQTKIGQTDKTNDDFVYDLLNGQLTYREMAIKYGRDYMRYFRAYNEFKRSVDEQERNIKYVET